MLAGIYHLQGKTELASLPKWKAIPFKSRARCPLFYASFCDILFRAGEYKTAEQFFTAEISLLQEEIKKQKEMDKNELKDINLFLFSLGICFHQRAYSRFFQSKNLTPEMKEIIYGDIKNGIEEIKKIVPASDGDEIVKKMCIQKYEWLNSLLNTKLPHRIMLIPKRQQPPIITIGKTVEESWNTSIHFEVDIVNIDE